MREQGNRKRILDKAKPRKLHFKNLHQTEDVCIWNAKAAVSKNLVSLVWSCMWTKRLWFEDRLCKDLANMARITNKLIIIVSSSYKYIEHVNQQQQAWGNKVITKEFSRKRNHERSTSRTFIRLKTCAYKRLKQQSVRIQSALYEVACEQNGCGLKIAVDKNSSMIRITNKLIIVVSSSCK